MHDTGVTMNTELYKRVRDVWVKFPVLDANEKLALGNRVSELFMESKNTVTAQATHARSAVFEVDIQEAEALLGGLDVDTESVMRLVWTLRDELANLERELAGRQAELAFVVKALDHGTGVVEAASQKADKQPKKSQGRCAVM